MRRSHSVKSVTTMQPEEAKVAASLLLLTSSDEQEGPEENCEYKSYIDKHCQFPYHTAVKKKYNSSDINTRSAQNSPNQHKKLDRSRSESCSVTFAQEPQKRKPGLTKATSVPLSKSAPTESQGFFQRLVPAFIRRKLSVREGQRQSGTEMAGSDERIQTREKDGSDSFAREFVMTTKMDSLIFMSMR